MIPSAPAGCWKGRLCSRRAVSKRLVRVLGSVARGLHKLDVLTSSDLLLHRSSSTWRWARRQW